MAKQYKAVPNGKPSGWLVIEFYKHPALGECHTNCWRDVLASSADMAVKFAKTMAVAS